MLGWNKRPGSMMVSSWLALVQSTSDPSSHVARLLRRLSGLLGLPSCGSFVLDTFHLCEHHDGTFYADFPADCGLLCACLRSDSPNLRRSTATTCLYTNSQRDFLECNNASCSVCTGTSKTSLRIQQFTAAMMALLKLAGRPSYLDPMKRVHRLAGTSRTAYRTSPQTQAPHLDSCLGLC